MRSSLETHTRQISERDAPAPKGIFNGMNWAASRHGNVRPCLGASLWLRSDRVRSREPRYCTRRPNATIAITGTNRPIAMTAPVSSGRLA